MSTYDAPNDYWSVGAGTDVNESHFYGTPRALSSIEKLPRVLNNWTSQNGATFDLTTLAQASWGGDGLGYTIYPNQYNAPTTCGVRSGTDGPCSGVYQMNVTSNNNYLAYMGGQDWHGGEISGTDAWVCPRVIDVGGQAFSCYGIDLITYHAALNPTSVADFGVIKNVYGKTASTFNITITTTLQGEALAHAWQLGWKRLYDHANFYTRIQAVASANEDRHTKSQTFVGIFFAIFVVGIVITSALVSVWFKYLSPIIGAPCYTFNFWFWFMIVLGFWATAILCGGFYGGLLVACGYNVYWFTAGLMYWLKARTRASNNACQRYTEAEMEELIKVAEELLPDGGSNGDKEDGDPFMTLKIITETGGKLKLNVRGSTTVIQVKESIEEVKDMPVDFQVLVCDGKEIRHEYHDHLCTLREYKIQDGAKMYVGTRSDIPSAYGLFPEPMGTEQAKQILVLMGMIFLVCVGCVILYFLFDVDTYQLLDRKTRFIITEYQPTDVARALQGLYAFEGFADYIYVDPFLRHITESCDSFDESLSDSEKKDQIQDAFIDRYSIDMSGYAKTTYSQFDNVNAWFARKLNQTTCTRVTPNWWEGGNYNNLCVRPIATMPYITSTGSSISFSPSTYTNLLGGVAGRCEGDGLLPHHAVHEPVDQIESLHLREAPLQYR